MIMESCWILYFIKDIHLSVELNPFRWFRFHPVRKEDQEYVFAIFGPICIGYTRYAHALANWNELQGISQEYSRLKRNRKKPKLRIVR